MKRMKKAISLLLVMVMAMAMSMTAFAAPSVDLTNHTYKAYQIFDGKQAAGSPELGQIVWGSGINDVAFLAALKDDTTLGTTFDACNTAAEVAKVLGGYGDSSKEALKFAELAYKHTKGDGTPVVNGQTELAAGYYLVVDVSNFGENETDTVYNLALLQLTNKETFTIETKTDIPSVDKEVLDEVEDAEADATNGWGETADHAINEHFKFKLTATLPADINFAEYETYKVVFHDTMSKGITFVSINSIKVDDATLTLGQNGVSTNAAAGTPGEYTFSITIDDLKEIPNVNLTDGAEIEVIYTAYLNEDANVNHQSGNTTNKNGVYLEYSNNPNADGTGKTKEDFVWVFTYRVDNTKYSEKRDLANVLAGAGFRLYTDEACTNEVALIWDADLKAYRPVKNGEAGELLVSRSEENLKGTFNIVGLDAGTYYLREKEVPAGYNQCPDVKIVIDATHIEASSGTSATTTLTEETQHMENHIVNEKGAVLPETGGMGTTMFYVIGAILAIGAAVLMITKKRMNEN